jgi:hypothetical protein
MTASRLLFGIGVAGLFGWFGACASVADSSGPLACEPQCGLSDASSDRKVVPETSVPESGQDSPQVVPSPLCGPSLECVPDDHESCASFAIDAGPAADSGNGEPDAAEEDDGGEDGGEEEEDGWSPFVPPDADSGDEPSGPAFGCQVNAGAKGPVAQCAPAGGGRAGDPCFSGGDCAAGFACVGDASTAQCRPYCCTGPEVCARGSYCAERTLRDSTLPVPVCVTADGCDLAQPYPCPTGATCTCGEGKACMVVADKTASCVAPGSGKEDESCPCAWGYFCNKTLNVCKKHCQLSSSVPECGSKKCQSVPYLPSGWGVCADA